MKSNLILLHGALGSKRHLQTLKTELEADFNVFDLDFEGHGDRQCQGEFSIERFAQNLIDFLIENKIDNTHVFGYSMGGYVAISAALKSPELFGGIVTYGTKFNWSPEIAAKEVKMLNPDVIEEKVPKFAQNLKSLHVPNDWKVMMQKTAQLMIGLGDGSGLAENDFKNLNHQITIGRGSADKMVTELESKNVAQLLPHGTFISLEEQPHPIEMVNSNVLVNYIRATIL
ncbi:MAG: pimeloyl-ACP methyl ester carboxylesterase [Crocinitomix sp.]|jgi:pimeloyl-ACP methyl ester carboxylesterase